MEVEEMLALLDAIVKLSSQSDDVDYKEVLEVLPDVVDANAATRLIAVLAYDAISDGLGSISPFGLFDDIMGGIGDIVGEELCPDLPALSDLGVALIATSPKDMLNIPATVDYLREHGVTVAGERCTGYVFCSASVETDGPLSDYPDAAAVENIAKNGGLLLLNAIPEAEREQDLTIVEKAVEAGKRAEAAGGYYHPAANAEIDRLTDGHSSFIQLHSFIANIRMTADIPEN